MRTLFYIRISELRDDATSVEYATAPADSPRSARSERAPLARVLELAASERLVVFVPSADIRLASVEVPARQPSKVLQAAPFLLEEQLADDVDTLHFALGPRQEDGSTPVAVVARERMQMWMARLARYGLNPEAVVPDVLALPFERHSRRWSALAERHQVLVRNGAWSGFCAAPEDLVMMLTLADPHRHHPLRLLLPGSEPVDVTTLDWPLEPMPGDRTAVEALARHYDADQAVNLMQGAWSPKSDFSRWLKPWRTAITAVAVWLIAIAAVYAIETMKLNREVELLQQANTERFRQLFPSETRIVDLQAQVAQQLRLLDGSGADRDAFALMSTMAEALDANPGLRVESMQFREGSLYLALTGDDLQVLESLRAWFAEQQGRMLEVQSANAGAEGVQIRVRVGVA